MSQPRRYSLQFTADNGVMVLATAPPSPVVPVVILDEPTACRRLVTYADLLAAAERVKADLDARIAAAVEAGAITPVFDGIAELHAAIRRAKGLTP